MILVLRSSVNLLNVMSVDACLITLFVKSTITATYQSLRINLILLLMESKILWELI
ncbi:hypothetical protein RirG_011850 [Rhizophagus irregularis DAOM 197198w]|uniref:Uncharacterized protein n=1 Tax=Rhizophagus irregularis (strain DAOM 197198w) TaxID=1432141 RepID=A0A015KGM9_RHIIW|nr:hypothetical protein RirG_011850 [Rhizophagus irregularis DAOM 197198w]